MAEIIKPAFGNLWAANGAKLPPSPNKIETGWTAEIPPHQWENWAQNRQDQAIGYIYQHGIPEWDTVTEYFANRSFVQHQGLVYRAITNSTNLSPTTNPLSWSVWSFTQVDLTPPGQINFFAQNTPPTGYLKANGVLISRLTYQNLFNAIGTKYGSGDGSTTFALPDLRGEFIRVWDDGRNVDIGRLYGTIQGWEVQSHTHGAGAQGAGQHDHTGQATAAGSHQHELRAVDMSGAGAGGNPDFQAAGDGGVSVGNSATAGNHVHSLSIDGNGNHSHVIEVYPAGGNETRPRNFALMACIKF